jgi:excisionase family DNA binding protein
MTEVTAELPISDVLYGANEIADFLRISKKRVYHMVEAGRLPVRKMGRTLTARRSTLLRAFEPDAA